MRKDELILGVMLGALGLFSAMFYLRLLRLRQGIQALRRSGLEGVREFIGRTRFNYRSYNELTAAALAKLDTMAAGLGRSIDDLREGSLAVLLLGTAGLAFFHLVVGNASYAFLLLGLTALWAFVAFLAVLVQGHELGGALDQLRAWVLDINMGVTHERQSVGGTARTEGDGRVDAHLGPVVRCADGAALRPLPGVLRPGGGNGSEPSGGNPGGVR